MRGVDTNVLVRLFVKDDPAQSATAKAFLERSCTEEEPCLINHVVLAELSWVLRTTYGYNRLQVAASVAALLQTTGIRVQDAPLVSRAVAAYRTGSADLSDYLIGGINKMLGCAATATFDRKAATHPDFELVGQ